MLQTRVWQCCNFFRSHTWARDSCLLLHLEETWKLFLSLCSVSYGEPYVSFSTIFKQDSPGSFGRFVAIPKYAIRSSSSLFTLDWHSGACLLEKHYLHFGCGPCLLEHFCFCFSISQRPSLTSAETREGHDEMNQPIDLGKSF